MIDEEQCAVVERLLRENISLRGLCCTLGVSMRWLMDFLVGRCMIAGMEVLHGICKD